MSLLPKGALLTACSFRCLGWKKGKRKRQGTKAKEGMWWNAMVAGHATVAGFADDRLRVVRHEVVGV